MLSTDLSITSSSTATDTDTSTHGGQDEKEVKMLRASEDLDRAQPKKIPETVPFRVCQQKNASPLLLLQALF